MSYECEARPGCPACGAAWSDEMVALFDAALGLGCSCCNPVAGELPDIVCHSCRKVLYTARETPREDTAPSGIGADLDLTP